MWIEICQPGSYQERRKQSSGSSMRSLCELAEVHGCRDFVYHIDVKADTLTPSEAAEETDLLNKRNVLVPPLKTSSRMS